MVVYKMEFDERLKLVGATELITITMRDRTTHTIGPKEELPEFRRRYLFPLVVKPLEWHGLQPVFTSPEGEKYTFIRVPDMDPGERVAIMHLAAKQITYGDYTHAEAVPIIEPNHGDKGGADVPDVPVPRVAVVPVVDPSTVVIAGFGLSALILLASIALAKRKKS